MMYVLSISRCSYLNIFQTDRIISRQQVLKEIGISHATIQRTGSRRFLTEDPREMIKQGRFQRMPAMTGFTKDEGSMIMGCKL